MVWYRTYHIDRFQVGGLADLLQCQLLLVKGLLDLVIGVLHHLRHHGVRKEETPDVCCCLGFLRLR